MCKRVVLDGYEEYQDFDDLNENYISFVNVTVRGDNESKSHDSRDYGPIPYGLIESRAVMKLWPLKDLRFFKRDS